MPLPSSFWVDEMGTVFVVHHGAADVSLRAAPQVAESIYYLLPKFAESIAGSSEITYRFFSVVAMACALLLIASLAGRLLHPSAKWFAVFACMALHEFNYQADDARPYAFGMFVLCAALWLMVRWLDTANVGIGLAFAAMAAMLWWVHLILWPFYIVFAIYAAVRVWRRDTSVPLLQVLSVAALISVGVAPVLLRALQLARDASAHVVAAQPQFGDLLSSLKLASITGACAAAVVLSRRLRWHPPVQNVSVDSVTLILSWWLILPVSLFAFSRIGGNSAFLARYLALGTPGIALMACLLVSLVIPFERWKPIALTLGIGVLIFSGQWGHLFPVHRNSQWREAASALRSWSAGSAVPIVCPSPFIEARSPVWRPELPATGFLYSHLLVYNPGGKTYSFPYEPSVAAKGYAQRFLNESVMPAGRFAIYGGDNNVGYWRQWFAARPELAAWKSRELGSFGDVAAVVFIRDGVIQN